MNRSRFLFELGWLLFLIAFHQSHSRFATDFNCYENKQSAEYVSDLKAFVREVADYSNRRETPDLDLSTTGLGFVDGSQYLAKSYQHYLTLNLSRNVIKKINLGFLLRFPHVQTLDLSLNCLTSIDIKHRLVFANLQFLNISDNLITNIHPFAFSNLSIDTLDLSHNRLIRFWASDYEVNRLFLNHNKLSQVEIDSGHSKEMKLLDASSNKIRIFQVGVRNFLITFLEKL